MEEINSILDTYAAEQKDEEEFVIFLKKRLLEITEARANGGSELKLMFELGILYRMLEQLNGDVVKLHNDFWDMAHLLKKKE